jgi:5-oxopent-3-ene-1,2,5-tricarboxylate decarboxylase/2-hydroxyhepta-2,4-diene-1,7-dioate isomerase
MQFAFLKSEEGTPLLAARHAGDGTYIDVQGALWAFRDVMGRDIVPLPLPASPLEAAQQSDRLSDLLPAAVETLAQDGELHRYAHPADSTLLSPLPRPTRILAIGRNYAEHAKESGAAVFEEPIVFLKASTSVVGPGTPIEVPDWVGQMDYEGELLVVIGTGGRYISEADAMKHVVGYSVFNDVTARTQQRADQGRKHPWFRSKSMDTSGPLGPYLVTTDEVPDPHNLALSLTLNGETKQNDTTASMVYRIPTLIAFLSKWFALEPGDVIATGTPSGVGPLVPGDTVSVTVEGVGTLTNPVIAAPPAPPVEVG